MRQLTVILLALAIILPVFAKPKNRDHTVIKTEIHCFKLQSLMTELRDKYGEEPIFIGKSEVDADATTMMFVNQTAGTYTIVGVGRGVGCVYDIGSDIKYRMPKILENKLL